MGFSTFYKWRFLSTYNWYNMYNSGQKTVVYLKLSHGSLNVEPDAWSLKSSAAKKRGLWGENVELPLHGLSYAQEKGRQESPGSTVDGWNWEVLRILFGECIYLVGALEHVDLAFIFPFSWECHHINWQTPSFFRGVGTPPTRYCIIL